MSKESDPHDEPDIPELPDELNAFARQLAYFEPKEHPGSREQALFKAGQESMRAELAISIRRYQRMTRVWQVATSALFMVSVGFGVSIVTRHDSPNAVIVTAESKSNSLPDESRSAPVVVAEPDEHPLDIASIPFDRLRARQVLIAKAVDGFAKDPDRSNPASGSPSDPFASQSSNLNSGSLLRGIPSQILIHQMMEDSTL